jgi:nucleoid-associated protein YgaU
MEKAPKPQDSEEKKGFSLDPQKSGIVKTYVVKQGDTLSKIAEKIYGDANQYEKIYKANLELIGDDPNLIKVGQELTIPAK